MSISHNSHTYLTRGYAAALLSAVILSTTGVLIRYLTEAYQLPALILAFWRDLIVALMMLPLLALLRPKLLHISRQHLPYLLIYGLILAAFNALWTLSVALNGAAIATVLIYSSAGFTVLLGWWLLQESLDWARITAVIVTLSGCVLVADALSPDAWQTNLLGIITALLSGLGFAVYSLMGRSASQRGLNPWTTLLYTFSFAAGFLLLINLIPGSHLPEQAARPKDMFWLGSSAIGWLILFLLGAGPTLAGYGAYNVALTYLPSGVVNLIVTLEPAFTAVFATIFLHERLTNIQIVGSITIMSGVVFLRIYEGWAINRGKTAPVHTL